MIRLPNKLYTFKESTLALLPPIMATLEMGLMPVAELREEVWRDIPSATDFIEALSLLLALRELILDEDKGTVEYAR
ncbi:ABC-three component system middle component 7 [Arcanobacterium ihumii]|uniref:ABC-three component system middle component 7 n=1 Tax=Arcanobacterium ihumii TaxID=2138162 RepID=UPI000F527E3F|nr:ABC-three component system middle component 7 [Arcanobacterium ihumii]